MFTDDSLVGAGRILFAAQAPAQILSENHQHSCSAAIVCHIRMLARACPLQSAVESLIALCPLNDPNMERRAQKWTQQKVNSAECE